MPKYPGLTRRGRGGVFQFRRSVPEALREALGKREIVVSLKTTDPDTAIERWREEDAIARGLFRENKSPTASGERRERPDALIVALSGERFATLESACDYFYRLQIKVEQDFRAITTGRAYREPGTFWSGGLIKLPSALPADRTGLTLVLAQAYRDKLRRQRETCKACLVVFDLDFIYLLARRVFSEEACNDPELLVGLMRSYIRFVDDFLANDELLIAADPEKPASEAANDKRAQPIPVSAGPLLSKVVADWVRERSSPASSGKRLESRWTAERKKSCESVMRDFLALVGDRPIGSYEKADARAYKEALLVLPSRWMKRKELRGMTFAMAADEARRLGLQPQDDRNINKKLGIAQQAFEYAISTHDELSRNPFKGLALSISSSANEDKDPFTTDELRAIFNAPPFVGARSERNWTTPGDKILRGSEKFWLPLLGLWTGMRCNEICQLTPAHVREHDGVRYFALTKELQLKGGPKGPSVRNVPMHDFLIEAGFLDYLDSCREGDRIFPTIPQAKTGRYSDAAGKQFDRLLDWLQIKHDKISFHSFRHTFIAATVSCGLEFSARERIVGHVLPGQAGRYGKKYVEEQQDMDVLAVRNRELQKVRFPGLDLSFLAMRL